MSAAARVPRRSRETMEGYALVAVSFLIWGAIGAFVRYSTMPESALNVLRMTVGSFLVGAIFARRSTVAEVRRRDVWPRLLLMGVLSASTILLFFIALRLTDASIGMFLLFTNPVYVALLAPRLMRQPADRIVYPSLAIALAEMVLDAVLLLPLGAWQFARTGYELTDNDIVAVLVLGVVCSAIPYVLYPAGLRHIRVEHASILGYLEPVSAPLYAFVLLGEAPALATIVGGALIVVAGVLVIRYGGAETLSELDARGAAP